MEKILLTGATGFIGKACLRLLQASNFEVHALTRDVSDLNEATSINWHNCDLLNLEQVMEVLARIRPHYLIHLAWYVEHGLFWESKLNIPYISATIHLYEQFSLQGGKKALLIGSSAEYQSDVDSCNEDLTPLLPRSLYGLAKKQTFELMECIKNNNPHYASFCWVRLFNIFGPYENSNRLIPYILRSFLQNESPSLNNPFLIRDHLYVDNLAYILIALLKSKSEGAINVGQGNELSIAHITALIQNRYFSDKNLFQRSEKNDKSLARFIPCLKKLNDLNIQLPFSFYQGLDLTYNWWMEHSR